MLRENSASGALAIRKWDFTTSLWRKSSSSRTAQGSLMEKAPGEKLRAFRGTQGHMQGCIPQHLHYVMTWKQLCLSQGILKDSLWSHLLHKCGKSSSNWNNMLKCLLPGLCLTKTHRQARITYTQYLAGTIGAEARMCQLNTSAWWLRWQRTYLQCRRPRFNPWVGKIPWRRKWSTHSRILAWRIPWTEEPGRLQSLGWQRVTWLSD